jgi:hypothetical protein
MTDIATARSMTAEFLRFVMPSNAVVELRALRVRDCGKNTVFSGRFDDMDALAKNAAAIQAKGYADGFYFTMNPLKPTATHVGYPVVNKMDVNCRTTRDTDVLHRTLIGIDVDPTRDSGICSTVDEKKAAYEVIQRVIAFLREHGWPEPVIVDSGSGYHAYFLADCWNPDDPAMRYLLKGLARRFDTPLAKVDTAVHNSSRIMRLPGTRNCKGQDTPERPHRLCHVISYPDKWEPVTLSQAYQLIEAGHLDNSVERKGACRDGDMPDLVDDPEAAIYAFEEFFKDHIEILTTIEQEGRTLYVLRECPIVGRAHKGAVGKSAIILWDNSVGYSCFSSKCAGKGMRELREHLERETGRKCRVRFYEHQGPTDEERAEQELEDYLERLGHNVQFRSDVAYDAQTWALIYAGVLESTDPADYGFDAESLRLPFMRFARRRECDLRREGDAELDAHIHRCCEALNTGDPHAMAQTMGPEELFLAYRETTRPPQPPLTEEKKQRIAESDARRAKNNEDRIIESHLDLMYIMETYEPRR